MTDECPYLAYRPLSDDGESGDGQPDDTEPGGDHSDDAEDAAADETTARAYCTAAEEFVQAMRADVCNDRYGLDHETDCEIFRDHEGLPEVPTEDGE